MEQKKSRHGILVRPYGTHLRQRVLHLLKRAEVEVHDQNVIPMGLPDAEVLRELKNRTASALIIPYHAHRDQAGNEVNGVDLGERILAELHQFADTPILMPASAVALPAIWLRMSPMSPHPISKEMQNRLLLLDEDQLETAETLTATIKHLGLEKSS